MIFFLVGTLSPWLVSRLRRQIWFSHSVTSVSDSYNSSILRHLTTIRNLEAQTMTVRVRKQDINLLQLAGCWGREDVIVTNHSPRPWQIYHVVNQSLKAKNMHRKSNHHCQLTSHKIVVSPESSTRVSPVCIKDDQQTRVTRGQRWRDGVATQLLVGRRFPDILSLLVSIEVAVITSEIKSCCLFSGHSLHVPASSLKERISMETGFYPKTDPKARTHSPCAMSLR